MPKPISVSDDNYNVLNSMRGQIPGKKAFESFDAVVTRLLQKQDAIQETKPELDVTLK